MKLQLSTKDAMVTRARCKNINIQTSREVAFFNIFFVFIENSRDRKIGVERVKRNLIYSKEIRSSFGFIIRLQKRISHVTLRSWVSKNKIFSHRFSYRNRPFKWFSRFAKTSGLGEKELRIPRRRRKCVWIQWYRTCIWSEVHFRWYDRDRLCEWVKMLGKWRQKLTKISSGRETNFGNFDFLTEKSQTDQVSARARHVRKFNFSPHSLSITWSKKKFSTQKTANTSAPPSKPWIPRYHSTPQSASAPPVK